MVATGLPLQAIADLQIRLKDGRVITVPVDQAEVGSIIYKKSTTPRSPAKRAADKIRDDAEQVRFASEAATQAAAAAKRAEEAAGIAIKAAEAAKEASREAATAAAEARRVAHKPSESADLPFPDAGSAAKKPSGKSSGISADEFPKKPVMSESGRRILSVGPGKAYAAPSLAAKAARDGDTIEIQAGIYRGDVAVWRANNLVIQGVGGRVVLEAAGKSAHGKAIWVIQGRNTTVQNIAFSGARVPDKNGAGIRLEGPGLIIRDAEFYDNEMGILTGSNPESDILIERSRFYRNTVDYPRYRRLGHNIYIGEVRSFILRFSHISGAQYGHNVKSRARSNRIVYNKIVDGHDGLSSYLLDLHGSEQGFVIGNILHQSRITQNWTMVSLGAENPRATKNYYVINNTFVNDKGSGVFVRRNSAGETVVINNLFVGGGTVLVGSGSLKSNLIVDKQKFGRIRALFSEEQTQPANGELKGNLLSQTAGFVDRENMDFRLRKDSPAIDAGAELPKIAEENLTPLFQYQRHLESDQRYSRRYGRGRIDIGAYEYSAD